MHLKSKYGDWPIHMIKDLAELRQQLEVALDAGDKELVFQLARKYINLYHQCWGT